MPPAYETVMVGVRSVARKNRTFFFFLQYPVDRLETSRRLNFVQLFSISYSFSSFAYITDRNFSE